MTLETRTAISQECPLGSFLVKFYANRNCDPPPRHQECVERIHYRWGDPDKEANAGPSEEELKEKSDGWTNRPQLAKYGMPNDNFSVRCDGKFFFKEGTYIFTAWVDDGIIVALDGKNIIYAWKDQGYTEYKSSPIPISRGYHNIQIFYYEHRGAAALSFYWLKR